MNKIVISRKFRSNDVNVALDGKILNPAKSQKVRNHSPDGFNVGYGGSGPAQLALAILLEVTDQMTASKYYQNFKWEYVAKWQVGQVHLVDILAWLKEQKDKDK